MGNAVDKARAWDAVIAARQDEREKIVAWLKREAELCDCFAREESECACGAWDGYKTVYVSTIIDALERGDHRKRNEVSSKA